MCSPHPVSPLSSKSLVPSPFSQRIEIENMEDCAWELLLGKPWRWYASLCSHSVDQNSGTWLSAAVRQSMKCSPSPAQEEEVSTSSITGRQNPRVTEVKPGKGFSFQFCLLLRKQSFPQDSVIKSFIHLHFQCCEFSSSSLFLWVFWRESW